MTDKVVEKVFKVLGLPKIIRINDTGAGPAVKRQVEKAIAHAPEVGRLIISGTASPVMQGLFKNGRKVAAISFLDLYNAKFTEDALELPPPRANQVTLIYAVGKEPVKNFEYSSKLLQGLMSSYESSGLVIIETHLSPSTFNMTYGLDILNKLSIPTKNEEVWI